MRARRGTVVRDLAGLAARLASEARFLTRLTEELAVEREHGRVPCSSCGLRLARTDGLCLSCHAQRRVATVDAHGREYRVERECSVCGATFTPDAPNRRRCPKCRD